MPDHTSARGRPSAWARWAICAASLAACSEPATNAPGSGQPWPGDALALADGATPTTGDAASGGDGDAAVAADGATGGDTATDGATAGPDAFVPSGPSCGKASACAKYDATPYCALDHQVCVECVVDFHCQKTTGHCEDYQCKELSCVPGQSQCQGNFLATCKPDGKGYDQQACPDQAPVCYGGTCLLCQPDQTDCAPPSEPGGASTGLRKCAADGQSATIIHTCPSGQSCFDGACGLCTPGSMRCTNHYAERCADDGAAWQIVEDCGSKGLTCLGGLCVNPCSADFKSNTNVGCDYWAVDLDNAVDTGGGKTYDAQNAQFSLIVSNTSSAEAAVTVTLGADPAAAGAKTKTWTVPAKDLLVINLPDKSWGLKNQNQEGTNVNGMVYRVQSTQPIVAYQFNPLQNFGVFSNDASLLLPSGSLGQEYWVVSRNQLGTKFRSYFNVIATAPGKTEVTVVVSAPTLAGVGVPSMSLGGKMTFTLEQGQALNVESNKENADLTGSWISADKPVAVFGGSEASNSPQIGNCIPSGKSFPAKVCAGSTLSGGLGQSCSKDADCPPACCADHLEEQLFPVQAWGKTYVGARFSPRGKELDAWRVLAAENGTTITLTPAIGVTVPTLNQGQFFEFQTTSDFLLQADKPVLLTQYMASSYATVTTESAPCTTDASCGQHGFLGICEGTFGKTCSPIGDPSMVLDVAVEQYLDDYIFLVPDKYKLNYITVVAPLGAVVKLDGVELQGGAFAPIAQTTWAVARLPIPAGKHTLSATQKVGLFVYGYDDDVSYGYPGGAGLN
jgi:hypothetical protein